MFMKRVFPELKFKAWEKDIIYRSYKVPAAAAAESWSWWFVGSQSEQAASQDKLHVNYNCGFFIVQLKLKSLRICVASAVETVFQPKSVGSTSINKRWIIRNYFLHFDVLCCADLPPRRPGVVSYSFASVGVSFNKPLRAQILHS